MAQVHTGSTHDIVRPTAAHTDAAPAAAPSIPHRLLPVIDFVTEVHRAILQYGALVIHMADHQPDRLTTAGADLPNASRWALPFWQPAQTSGRREVARIEGSEVAEDTGGEELLHAIGGEVREACSNMRILDEHPPSSSRLDVQYIPHSRDNSTLLNTPKRREQRDALAEVPPRAAMAIEQREAFRRKHTRQPTAPPPGQAR